MRLIIVCSFLLLVTNFAIGQEYIFSDNINLKGSPNGNRITLPIVYKNTASLFLLDKKNIQFIQFSDDYKITNNYTATGLSKEYEILVGYSVNSLGYHLLFSDKKWKEFYTKSFSHDGKEEHDKELAILSKNERFLEAINYNESLYIFTVDKFSSILNVYIFNGDRIIKAKKFDFSEFKFGKFDCSNDFDEEWCYYELYDVVYASSRKLEIQKIESDNPSTLSLSTQKKKMYLINETVYLTFDNETANTKVLSINLNSLTASVALYEQKDIISNDIFRTSSNSYICNNYLYQVIANLKQFALQIRNLNNGEIIKEFSISSDEQIQFTNTALTQIGTQFSSSAEKELNSTSQFLKKVLNGEFGISVDFIENNYILTIGSVEYNSGTGGVMMSTPGGMVSTSGGSFSMVGAYHYLPIMHTYNSYNPSRSVYFKTILEPTNLAHIKGAVPDNSFDRIIDFEKIVMRNKINTKTIFRVNSDYLFGYYNEYEGRYYIVRFN